MTMSNLVVVGACYLDTILSVPHYPREDEKLRAIEITCRRGGNGPNTLEVLQQLISLSTTGIQAENRSRSNATTATSQQQHQHQQQHLPSLILCSVLPARSSPAVTVIQSSFGHDENSAAAAAAAVDLSHCLYREEHTEAASSYIIRSLDSGSRTLVNYNALPEMELSEFVDIVNRLDGLAGDAETYWFHFEGRIPDVTLECIRYLRRVHPSSVKISVEVEKPGRPGLVDLAALAHVIFYSRSWAQNEGYTSAEECLRAQVGLDEKSELLCCTWGEDGAAIIERSDGNLHQVAAFKIAGSGVIDSTGAGDTFIAGMLFGLMCRQGWSIDRKLEFANDLAGRKVAQEGFSGLGLAMLKYFRQPS